MAMAQIMRTTRTPRRIKTGIVTSHVVRLSWWCHYTGSEGVRKGREQVKPARRLLTESDKRNVEIANLIYFPGKAAGRARVAKDSMDMSGIQLKEAEQNALADQALADFAAKEGIALEPSNNADAASPGTEGSTKTMGPQTEKS